MTQQSHSWAYIQTKLQLKYNTNKHIYETETDSQI